MRKGLARGSDGRQKEVSHTLGIRTNEGVENQQNLKIAGSSRRLAVSSEVTGSQGQHYLLSSLRVASL